MKCESTIKTVAAALAEGDLSVITQDTQTHLRGCRKCSKELRRVCENHVRLSLVLNQEIPSQESSKLTRKIMDLIKQGQEEARRGYPFGVKEWMPGKPKKPRKKNT